MFVRSPLSKGLGVLTLFLNLCLAIPYSEYILAPHSRSLYPSSICVVNGSVSNAASLVNTTFGHAVFNGTGYAIRFDYGVNIGGLVTTTAGNSSSPNAFIGITFSESSFWINPNASDAQSDAGLDEVLWLPVGRGPGKYRTSPDRERGGFRYLSIISNTSDLVEITSVVTEFTAAPDQDLRAYSGWFNCTDELINRIWYAGKFAR